MNIGNCPVVRVHYIRGFIGRDIRCLQLNRSDWAVRSFEVTATRLLECKTEVGVCCGIEINDRKTRHYIMYIIILITRLK